MSTAAAAIRQGLRRLLLHEAFLADWLTAGGIILISQLVTAAIEPTHRAFSPADPSLGYPLRESTVSTEVLFILALVAPAVAVGFAQALPMPALAPARVPHWLRDVHHGCLTAVEALSVAIVFKNWANLYAGRLRPHFLAALATEDPAVVRVGRLAYPSGHAAYSMTGLAVISLHLWGRLGTFSSRPQSTARNSFGVFLLTVAPLHVAVFVAVSRVVDFKHDFSDINAGMALGLLSAAVCYHLNFHPLASARAGAAFSRDPEGTAKALDESGSQEPAL
jgi:diacylglycerol diphosphate phosphatase/phosphatidate phosphatase